MKMGTLYEISKYFKYHIWIHKNGNLYPSKVEGIWFKDLGNGQYKKMVDKVPEHNITEELGL